MAIGRSQGTTPEETAHVDDVIDTPEKLIARLLEEGTIDEEEAEKLQGLTIDEIWIELDEEF